MSIAETHQRRAEHRCPSRHYRAAGIVLLVIGLLPGLGAAQNLAVPETAAWSVRTPDSGQFFEHVQHGTLNNLLQIPLVDYPLKTAAPPDPLAALVTALTPLITEGGASLRNPFAGPAAMFGQYDETGQQSLAIILTISDRLLIYQYVQRAIPRLQSEYPNLTESRIGNTDIHLLTRAPAEDAAFVDPFGAAKSWWTPTALEPGQLLKRFDTLAVAIADRRLIVTTSLVAMRAALSSNPETPTPSLTSTATPSAAAAPPNPVPAWLTIEIDVPTVLATARRQEQSAVAQRALGLDGVQKLRATVSAPQPSTGIQSRLDLELFWNETPDGLLGALKFADAAPPRAEELSNLTVAYLGVNFAPEVTFTRLCEMLTSFVPGASIPAIMPMMSPPGADASQPADLSNVLRPHGAVALSWSRLGPSELGLWLEQAAPDSAAPLVAAWNTLQKAAPKTETVPTASTTDDWFSVTWKPGPATSEGTLAQQPRFAAAVAAVGPDVGLLWFDDERARLEMAREAFKSQLGSEPPYLALLGASGLTPDDIEQARQVLGERGAYALAITARDTGLRVTALRTVAAPPASAASPAATPAP